MTAGGACPHDRDELAEVIALHGAALGLIRLARLYHSRFPNCKRADQTLLAAEAMWKASAALRYHVWECSKP